jgi:hypothetical protein
MCLLAGPKSIDDAHEDTIDTFVTEYPVETSGRGGILEATGGRKARSQVFFGAVKHEAEDKEEAGPRYLLGMATHESIRANLLKDTKGKVASR